MLINGIEHALRLWVDDDNGESICNEVFSSFEEMNEFVPIICTLNKKGYITSACCSGHIYENHCTN